MKEELRGRSGDESDGDGPRDSKRQRADGQRNLYGNLHVSGVRARDLEGGLGLWFLFTVSNSFIVRGPGVLSSMKLHVKRSPESGALGADMWPEPVCSLRGQVNT